MSKTQWPIWLGLLSLALWALYALLAISVSSPEWLPSVFRLPAEDQSSTVLARRGQFGDAFGAFNALVSTFALIGLFFTIRSQQLQIEAQAGANRSNEQLTRQQQFQEQYYRAIDAYRELLSEISYGPEADPRSVANGRVALWKIWRDQIIVPLDATGTDDFGPAIQKQIAAYANEALGEWNTNSDAAVAIQRAIHALAVDAKQQSEVIARIGAAWAAVYNMHRFQLDSLFRSWYTAYRVLGTAKRYGIAEDSILLYSAVFRAQLSWIEMAFLLANQSALPGNPAFPRACHFSNEFVLFDNLDVAHDSVVAVLYQKATANSCSLDREVAMLCGRAFSRIGTESAA